MSTLQINYLFYYHFCSKFRLILSYNQIAELGYAHILQLLLTNDT